MSAINFRADVERVSDPAGDRVRITFDGKFLPYQGDDFRAVRTAWMSTPCTTSQDFPSTHASLADAVASVHRRDLEPGHRSGSLPSLALELRYPLDV